MLVLTTLLLLSSSRIVRATSPVTPVSELSSNRAFVQLAARLTRTLCPRSHSDTKNESRCPGFQRNGAVTPTGTYDAHGGSSRRSENAVSKPTRLRRCRPCVASHLRMHIHHICNPKACSLTALIRFCYPRWQSQPCAPGTPEPWPENTKQEPCGEHW